MVDETALRNKIAERRFTYSFVSDVLGITRSSLENKITGKTQFKLVELAMLRNMLHLTNKEFNDIFFAD